MGSAGKADGFIYDQLTIYRNHMANPDTREAVFIPFQDTEHWGIAVKKGNTKLLSQINAFLSDYSNLPKHCNRAYIILMHLALGKCQVKLLYKQNGGFDKLTEKYLSEEKKAFDELQFKWFFDFSDEEKQ